MNRLAIEIASQAGIWIPIFAAIFIAIFVPLLVRRAPRKEDYLKRVAKKYSIPPLDLR